jgi:hypothetical protein
VRRILDIGTGSGCIAIACARAFPRARVDATDISPPRWRSAGATCAPAAGRVRVLRSDHFARCRGASYDIIVSNPPYVGRAEMRRLPPEYRHEPRWGWPRARRPGLGANHPARRAAHLNPGGILVVEVGNSEAALLRAYPRTAVHLAGIAMRGGGGVFMLAGRQIWRADDMSGNTFGRLFTVTTFGESHGPALGCIVDGCPPGLALSEADLQPTWTGAAPAPRSSSASAARATRCGSCRACSRGARPAPRSGC